MVKPGDIFVGSGNRREFKVILVAFEWVWLENHSYPNCEPRTVRLSILEDPMHYTLKPPFKVGDTVEFYVGYSACGTVPDRGKVLAIHEDRAWVIFPGRSVPLSPLITSLRKAA